MTQLNPVSELYCPNCGYDLRQIDSLRCPECGMEIDRSSLGGSIIPWLHRGALGRRRAFWRTIEMVSLRPRALAREMNCPAHLADAIKFRRVVVLHALVPFGIAMTLAWAFSPGKIWVGTDVIGSTLQLASLLVAWFCLAAFMWGATGSASYFFHPASLSILRQNRAVALSYYACAPLAYLPLTSVLSAAALLFLRVLLVSDLPVPIRGAIGFVGIIPLAGNLVLLLRSPFVLMRAALWSQSGRPIVVAACLPVLWLFWAAITFIVLPGVWFAVVVMIVSLYA